MKRLNRIFGITLLLSSVVSWQVSAKQDAVAPGKSRFGEKDQIEYIVGDLPVIISVPHGGRLAPTEMPDRKSGVLLADENTDLLAREIVQAIHRQTGKYPHVIICHLKRIKLDCNREVKEAAQGNAEAERAWQEFHNFIEQARESVVETNGAGLYIDLHGHGHPEARIELGYLLSNNQLKIRDSELEGLKDQTSIRQLADDSKVPFVELLRGDASFGWLMQQRGFPAVPSPEFPHAGGEKYFNGGYNSRRYGSLKEGKTKALDAAKKYRDGLVDEMAKFAKPLWRIKRTPRTNTGELGVSKTHYTNRSGKKREVITVTVRSELGKAVNRKFSVDKLGYKEAVSRAVAWRNQVLKSRLKEDKSKGRPT